MRSADVVTRGYPGGVVERDRRGGEDEHGFVHLQLALVNLRDLARHARNAGLDRLVLPGVVESQTERARYAAAAGGDVIQIRLRSPTTQVSAQLRHRHDDDPERLA